tara:strand:+ start:657 stop:917 length:261 start_codon:yes stop_codon:yes gene_type:complete
MTAMDDFSIDQLMLFIGGILGSIGALLLVIQKSKCEEVNCCCLKCKRNVQAIIDEERLKLTGHTGQTPRKEEDIVKLELKEPEPED